MRILVIEDETLVRFNILEILDSGGFEAIGSADGVQGVRLAKEMLPDLIICDIKMPDFDGYWVLNELQQDPNTVMIPFIFLTAKVDKEDVRQGMNLGADDYLTKPFRRTELLEAVATRLHKKERWLKTQAQAQTQVEKLQHLNALKNDFVGAVSHDLRTPLANIQTALQLMDSATTPADRQDYLSVALSSCREGNELIAGLLDWYRLEAGERTIEFDTIELISYVQAIAESFQARVRDRQQTLTLDLPDSLPLFLSDRTILKRVLVELLNNACKYTPDGGAIALTVRSAGESVIFGVHNQAEIAAVDLPYLFERFYRAATHKDSAEASHSHNLDSSIGLGLTLVKKWVEHLQGKIQVHSDAEWTTFKVQLPLQPTQ